MAARKLFAEELLTATLCVVGKDVRLVSDERLTDVLAKAAEHHAEVFGAFRLHPVYQDCPVLREALQALDLGGLIRRENASLEYFRVAPHAAGAYGERLLEMLPQHQRHSVREVAEQIRDTCAVAE